MKYPKAGEKFYWKNLEGEIFEDTCLKIEGKDIPTLETMFFIELTKNGGGYFVTESDIIDSNSDEVKKFKKELAEKKVKKVIDYLNQKEVRKLLMAKLIPAEDLLGDDWINIEDLMPKEPVKSTTFWDYVDTLEDGSDDWRYAMQLGQKYYNAGKNPDEYLEEIIKKVNKK